MPIGVILFFRGKAKNKQDVLSSAKKNVVTDVIIPLFALLMTFVLLYNFNWVGQFSITSDAGTMPNWWAIGAMLVGFIVFPLSVMLYRERKLNH